MAAESKVPSEEETSQPKESASADTPQPKVPSDEEATQNFVDWYIDPLARTVSVDPVFGAMPLHLKHDDDFSWRLHFKVGGAASANPVRQLTNLSELRFLMLEKGRYEGTPLAVGVTDGTWDETHGCYTMAVSLNADALTAYLATLDATSTGFATGGFDCKGAATKAAGTVTTKTTTQDGGTSSTTTVNAPGKATPSALTDYEFMAEFRWVQAGKQMRSQTFSIFVARDLITSAPSAVVVAPPPLPTDWRFLAALASEGTPFTGEVFGYFRAPLQLEVLGLQVAVQEPDATKGFRVQLTDNAGADLGGGNSFFGDVPAGATYANLIFGQVLALNQGGEVRAKIKNYAGDDAAGLVVNLICRQYLTNSPAGPSGPPGITSATATTLEPGVAASASVAGQVLNLGIPKGAKGDKGQDGTTITEVDATTRNPGTGATAILTGSKLTLGIPQGQPGTDGKSVNSVQLGMVDAPQQSSASLTNGTLQLTIQKPKDGTNGINGTNGKDGTNISKVTVTMPTDGTPSGKVVGTELQLIIPYPAVQGSVVHAANFQPDVSYTADNDFVAALTFNAVGKRIALVAASFTNADDAVNQQGSFTAKIERVVNGQTSNVVEISGSADHTGNGSFIPCMIQQVDPNGVTPTGPITYNLRVQGFGPGGGRKPGTARAVCMSVTEF